MSIVICKLPKAGLGNQLFPLMKAFTFGYLNNLPVIVTGYNRLSLASYLKGYKSKRNYKGYFTFQKNIIGEQFDKLKVLRYRNSVQKEDIELFAKAHEGINTRFFYSALPHWSDYFHDLKGHRKLVIQLFGDLINPAIIEQVNARRPPCIGVHVRMGDYRKLKSGENFSKVGLVRTPETYFVNVINGIREVYGSDLPVSVFTDGYKEEFESLFKLNNIQLVDGNKDIMDLMLLSRSKIIIASAGSTFSYWAGFLSNAPLILHPQHIHQSIRPAQMGEKIYEGAFDSRNNLLVENIKSLQSEVCI